MSPLILAAAPYLPSLGYLGIVCGLVLVMRSVPVWIHPTLLVGGVIARLAQAGWAETLIPLAVGSVAFVVLVGLAGRTVSGVTLFSLVVTIALTPIGGYPWLLIGLGLAAAVALIRTWRHLGKGRVMWLTMDTLSAMGVSPAGGFKVPELDLVPDREALNAHNDVDAGRLRMSLPPYLLLGVVCAAGSAALFG